MTHWAEKYLGVKWTPDQDCFYWFQRIQAMEFGRDIENIQRSANKILSASHLMSNDNIAGGYGWIKTDTPIEGDAVFLSKRVRPHHIGTVAMIDKKIKVVHVPEFRGGMISGLLDLRINGWTIKSFWTLKHEN
jgi:hypothetical protein